VYYIRISRLNGRNDYYQLAVILEARGYEDRVDYFDRDPFGSIDAHLRFKDGKDALAYSLTYGGNVTREIPVYKLADS
jgi:hypothetical protein